MIMTMIDNNNDNDNKREKLTYHDLQYTQTTLNVVIMRWQQT